MADAPTPTAIDLETVLADYGQQIATYARDLAMSRAHAAALAAEVAELRQQVAERDHHIEELVGIAGIPGPAMAAPPPEPDPADKARGIDLARLDPSRRKVTDSPQA